MDFNESRDNKNKNKALLMVQKKGRDTSWYEKRYNRSFRKEIRSDNSRDARRDQYNLE